MTDDQMDAFGRDIGDQQYLWPRTDTRRHAATDLLVVPLVLLATLWLAVAGGAYLAGSWAGGLLGAAFWGVTFGQIIIREFRLRRQAYREAS